MDPGTSNDSYGDGQSEPESVDTDTSSVRPGTSNNPATTTNQLVHIQRVVLKALPEIGGGLFEPDADDAEAGGGDSVAGEAATRKKKSFDDGSVLFGWTNPTGRAPLPPRLDQWATPFALPSPLLRVKAATAPLLKAELSQPVFSRGAPNTPAIRIKQTLPAVQETGRRAAALKRKSDSNHASDLRFPEGNGDGAESRPIKRPSKTLADVAAVKAKLKFKGACRNS
ncbi:hypothetical protein BV898_18155 [Hypsibius exemplaris]|uniref:Uncharacterized protein n=1 Tax=Hypsibius exemplaris TaxID=2072580 RepID=A0A9X6RMV4_HYPEX|nr:hypothetical protein BV898_18155 [Hypsibius exemplaris]